ncbi:HK97-gp10 family putative phage morphogenesis protein [Paenibacillus woosongensis]|uniref:HK97 gp10 family phage protein n=1 Tax=Paenibacillus woosongensis TaxID=307580 RepID=A0ABQ4MR77_9BACL|nr:HK97-gp10 family putative phage morphogenesis protein [Paenibacillus woosongensis]GIP57910.1 hypothetical protein J15TS10_17240 [Paenibacillus woosongensis]
MAKGFKNMDRLLRKINKLDGDVKKELRTGVGQATKLVQGDAKDNAAVNEGQLQNQIYEEVKDIDADTVQGRVYTNVGHAPYVEFGTGPVGEANNADLPPELRDKISYRQDGWWIHESQIDAATAEKYHFFKIGTSDGDFYYTRGMVPQPFMYPAAQGRKEDVPKVIASHLRKAAHRLGGGN